jgi:hypothetical protein
MPTWVPLTVLLALLAVADVTTAVLGVKVFGRGATDPAYVRQAKWYGMTWLLGFAALLITVCKVTPGLSDDEQGLLGRHDYRPRRRPAPRRKRDLARPRPVQARDLTHRHQRDRRTRRAGLAGTHRRHRRLRRNPHQPPPTLAEHNIVRRGPSEIARKQASESAFLPSWRYRV